MDATKEVSKGYILARVPVKTIAGGIFVALQFHQMNVYLVQAVIGYGILAKKYGLLRLLEVVCLNQL